jgi:hypothetical protein
LFDRIANPAGANAESAFQSRTSKLVLIFQDVKAL